MCNTTQIVQKIFKNITLTNDELHLIANTFEKVYLKKDETLLKINTTVKNQYYVYSGCLRTFYIDKTGKEHTLQFAIEDWWISDYTAFFSSGKAIMNIESIQNATLLKLSRTQMEHLLENIPALETFFRKKMERAFSSFQKRILSNLALSAQERYVAFVNTYPNIEQSVKNYHIASYLGITTESLSRIRKTLTKG